jgi:superfamily II DNA or RNA helicase
MTTSAPPEQGQLVSVRERRFIVTDVARGTLPKSPLRPPGNGAQHLVSLSSVEDDALGEELQVFWELEPGAKVIEKVALPDPTGYDDPIRLDAFLDAVRWGAVSTADVKSIQAPFRSGIDIEDYQLDPVVRAIQMPRVNMLIADDVGLGKTIEAGMTILELIIRHRCRKVMVVCPAPLQIQWKEQMRDKFGLDFRIVDSAMMRDLRRKRGIHVNPWTHFPRLITSVDFLKRERPLRLFRETLPGDGAATYPRKFDMLIVDEAHHCAPSGSGRYATDSLRTHALRVMVPHFEHKLFLTATPHNGYPESFTALLELLDNQRFARGTKPDRKQLDTIMVRRLKSELPPRWDGTPRFPKRTLIPIEVDYTDEEKELHLNLQRYSKLRQKNVSDNAERFACEFVLKILKKRLFSSPHAFKTTLEQHERSLKNARKRGAKVDTSPGILQRQLDRVEEEFANDEDYEEATHDALEVAGRLFRDSTGEEQEILKKMKVWAAKAAVRADSKADQLFRWLHDHIKPNGKWCKERVIIFTEYRATQNWLQTLLAAEGFGGDRLTTMYGGMDPKQREAIKAAFQTDPAKSSVRILLATDSASEGIDLQNYCSKLIHVEIPWNPNRMEQRNGRIDRHGQKADEVLIHHFVAKGYQDREKNPTTTVGDLEADLEFLMRAARKVEAIREDLGKVGPVIATQVEEAMLGRRSTMHTGEAEEQAGPIRKMLKFERDLEKQVKELMDKLQETQREMRLSPNHIQKAVEVALKLAEQPALIPTEVAGIWPDDERNECPVFEMPPFTGSWERCLDGIYHPHTGEARPIVFDHKLAERREDVVLVHLNHPLVQMSLRLLRAEVWSTEGLKKLHRITARVIPDHVIEAPAMIAHARLVLIGGDSHRLHEEVITAGGLIRDGRFSRMNVGEVTEALKAGTNHEPSAGVKKTLMELWPKVAPSLVQALDARMNARKNGREKDLTERAEKEASDIRMILAELKKTIEEELNEPEERQLKLFSSPEREEFERNENALRDRLATIPVEIERETEAIKARFANIQSRMFPVSVTFLIPEKFAK